MTAKQADNTARRESIEFGGERIDFAVTFNSRRNLRICVRPDLSVTVAAPAGRAMEDVLARVRKRAPWIIRQRLYFEQFLPRPTPKRYLSGETFRYLGRQYRLKVIDGQGNGEAKLIGRFLHVRIPDRRDRDGIRRRVDGWYREHAKAVFERRLQQCHDVAKRHGVPMPSVRIRKMKRRWGSCTKLGAILLNSELVKAPLYCIDYVITHELCHLKFPNHSRGFYRLLSRCMPDWERRKERLEQVSL